MQYGKERPLLTPYERKAHYYETDQMGIIHHSNYVRWMEEARVHLLDQVGFSYKRVEEEGVTFPVLGLSCTYKSMVRYDDVVNIYSAISQYSRTRMTVAYKMEDKASGILRFEGESYHCFLNREGRPVSMKKAIPQFYELLCYWGEENSEAG
ncbi:MAG: acyl-CoA thioesterase [Clostridiales bacterium]